MFVQDQSGIRAGNVEPPEKYEEFLEVFTSAQLRIMTYIWSMIQDQNARQDVYQETTLALWKSFHTYRPDQEFQSWALGVARHQVLRYWRMRDRDRLVFGEPLLAELAQEGVEMVNEYESRQAALNHCLQRLPARQRDLVRQFYGEGKSASDVAEQWGRSVHAVYKSLKLLRKTLLKCVELRFAEEQA